MSDIRTTTEEFSVSGSLSNVKSQVESTEPVFESHPEFKDARILERLTEPERIITCLLGTP